MAELVQHPLFALTLYDPFKICAGILAHINSTEGISFILNSEDSGFRTISPGVKDLFDSNPNCERKFLCTTKECTNSVELSELSVSVL